MCKDKLWGERCTSLESLLYSGCFVIGFAFVDKFGDFRKMHDNFGLTFTLGN